MLTLQNRVARKWLHLLTTVRTQHTRHRLIRLGGSLGPGCVVEGRHRITVAPGARLWIGARVFIGEGVSMDLGPGAQLTIEEGVCIRDGCAIRCNGRMTVGAGSFLNAGALFECHGEIQIGERVLISPQVHLYDFDHGTLDCETPIMHQPCQIGSIQIGAGAWLGAKVTVKRDVRIGAGAIVGANAVVTHDLPDRAIAMGIPARVNGFRKADSLTESTASVNASADRLQVP